MLPVVSALQVVVVVQALQTLALVAAVAYVIGRLKATVAETRLREEEREQATAAELKRMEATVRAARAEAATFLQSIFTGVQGIARNLDATRTTTAEALEELRQKAAAPPAEPPPTPPRPPSEETQPLYRTMEEPRPVELFELRRRR
jgi:hypothetical protein